MEILSEEDYKYFRDLVLNSATQNINPTNLCTLKTQYETDVNSTRRIAAIQNLEDLIKVLEKRSCLSRKNVLILYEISNFLNMHQIVTDFRNQQLKKHIPNKPFCENTNARTDTIQKPPSNIKEQVHLLIFTELGKSWIDFARSLDVRECELDMLKMKYPNQSNICTMKILQKHEQNAHPRVWKTMLLEALTTARRNELRKSVQNIFDTYS